MFLVYIYIFINLLIFIAVQLLLSILVYLFYILSLIFLVCAILNLILHFILYTASCSCFMFFPHLLIIYDKLMLFGNLSTFFEPWFKIILRGDSNLFFLDIWSQDHLKVNNRLGVLRATQVVSVSVGFCLQFPEETSSSFSFSSQS